MGTMIQRHRLTEADYRGTRFAEWPSDLKGNNDLLTLTQPQIITDIHAAYLDAGADLLETNTFNANAISLADYGMQALAYELNVEGADWHVASPMSIPPAHPTSRALSRAFWAPPAVPRPFPPTSRIPAPETSPTTRWSRRTRRRCEG